MTRLAAAGLLAALTGCIAPPSDSPEACAFTRVASFPVEFRGVRPMVRVTMDGKPADLLLDTGATGTVVTQAAADRLALRQDRSFTFTMAGMAGQVVNYGTVVQRIGLGEASFRDQRLVVLASGLSGFGTPAPDGLLGNDLLGLHDVDFDLPNNRVTLYRRRDCPSGGPPWSGPATRLPRPPGAAPRNRPHLAVRLNDVPMIAFLDTGAGTTLVDTAAAGRAGVGAPMLDAAPVVQVGGVTPGTVPVRAIRFARLDVGDERLQAPTLMVTDLRREADMVLGAPFMRRHRIWMAYGTQSLFIGPATGPAP